MLSSAILAVATLFAAGVSAHGAVTSYIIDGKTYPGYTGFSPNTSPPTIQRQWPNYDPIFQVSSSAMRCNGGTSAALSAPVAAGGSITAKWSQWTHAQGPVMVWMYRCPGALSACDGSGKGWFKIDQEGMTAPPLSGTSWGCNKVMKDLQWTSKVPKSLPSGNYLVRHELLALHQAKTPQFYPECAQIEVTGGGSTTPSGDYLASIPAYASQSDPGVTVDTYQSTQQTYTPPGPKVWTG